MPSLNSKQFRIEQHNAIALALMEGHKTDIELAKEFGVSNRTIWEIAKLRGIKRKPGRGAESYKFKQAVK